MPLNPSSLAATFDSNADSNAGERWRTAANGGELLILAVNFKMNPGEPWRTLANDGPADFKTDVRHPWRCRRTDRSRRAPAILPAGVVDPLLDEFVELPLDALSRSSALIQMKARLDELLISSSPRAMPRA